MRADDRLDELAGSVSDGVPVDWDVVEAGAEAEDADASVRAMREVERIADFNRELQRMPEGETGARPHGTSAAPASGAPESPTD